MLHASISNLHAIHAVNVVGLLYQVMLFRFLKIRYNFQEKNSRLLS